MSTWWCWREWTLLKMVSCRRADLLRHFVVHIAESFLNDLSEEIVRIVTESRVRREWRWRRTGLVRVAWWPNLLYCWRWINKGQLLRHSELCALLRYYTHRRVRLGLVLRRKARKNVTCCWHGHVKATLGFLFSLNCNLNRIKLINFIDRNIYKSRINSVPWA